MKKSWETLVTRWTSLTARERCATNALILIVVGYIAHYLVFTIAQPFYIEDCAITFSYARNLVHGEGLVPFPGGERVEGYSNPLWMFLIAAFLGVKVPVWTSSKLLGAALGVLTMILSWAICRRARGGRNDAVNLIPPFLLAASTQFVVWNSSGLENSLFCLLLTAAMYRTIKEGTDGGKPWSALLFFLLSITRPEGIAYVAVGIMARFIFALRQGRIIRTMLVWLLAFTLPFALYQWWHYDYFAWPFPNTYYAKLGEGSRFKPFGWTVRGWKYLNGYMLEYWVAWATPFLFLAAAGLKRWRAAVGIFLLAGFTVLVLWNGKADFLTDVAFWKPIQREWVDIRVWWIFASAVLLGLLTLGRPGWRALSMTWAMYCSVFLLIIYTGGDWMDAYRWVNMLVVPQFILLAIGFGELADRLPHVRLRLKTVLFLPGKLTAWLRKRSTANSETPGPADPQRIQPTWMNRLKSLSPPLPGTFLLLATVALALPNSWRSYHFATHPETGVRDVRRRVEYMSWVQKRLHLDHVQLLDVDMGAHLWYSGWEIMDVAGLVEIPLGHHNYEKKFIKEHIFEFNHPDFIHSHGGWSRRTKINNFPEFKKTYFEIPGYPAGRRSLHLGNYVRKDHWVSQGYDGPSVPRIKFQGALTLHGWLLPSDIVPVGGKFFLQTWFEGENRKKGVRVLVFLTDGEKVLTVEETAPGYDWYLPRDWKRNEIIFTGYDIPIPKDLPEGDYQVGLVLLDQKSGKVLRPISQLAPTPPSEQDQADDPTTRESPAGVEATSSLEDRIPKEKDRRLIEQIRRKTHPRNDSRQDPTRGQRDLSSLQAGQDTTIAVSDEFTYMRGEYLLPGATLHVVSRGRATKEAHADLDLALDLAQTGACDEAWSTWWDARRHLIRNIRWQNENAPAMEKAVTECLARRATAIDDPYEKAQVLIQARILNDHRNELLLSLTRPLAAQLESEGDQAMEEEDWESAFTALRTAVKLDPRLSHARRKAEYCRDKRLNIKGVGSRSFLDSFKSRKKNKSIKKNPPSKTNKEPRQKGATPKSPAKPSAEANPEPRPEDNGSQPGSDHPAPNGAALRGPIPTGPRALTELPKVDFEPTNPEDPKSGATPGPSAD